MVALYEVKTHVAAIAPEWAVDQVGRMLSYEVTDVTTGERWLVRNDNENGAEVVRALDDVEVER